MKVLVIDDESSKLKSIMKVIKNIEGIDVQKDVDITLQLNEAKQKLLETRYDLSSLPEVVATKQDGVDTSKEGLVERLDVKKLQQATDNLKAANLAAIFCDGTTEVIFFDKSKKEYVRLANMRLAASEFVVGELVLLLGSENVAIKY